MIHETRLFGLYVLGASSLALVACGAHQSRLRSDTPWRLGPLLPATGPVRSPSIYAD